MHTSEFRVYNARSLGDAVRHYRQQAGLTQAQLADAAGIPRLWIARLEAGETTEQTRRLVDLLRTLGARLVVREETW